MQFCTPKHRFRLFFLHDHGASDMYKKCLRWRLDKSKNLNCVLIKEQRAQGPLVVELLFPFSSLCVTISVVFLFIFKKCYFTAVVSYFCKQFANQNAMYSRYGLYFRFTALQTVCKYDQLNKGKYICVSLLYLFKF